MQPADPANTVCTRRGFLRRLGSAGALALVPAAIPARAAFSTARLALRIAHITRGSGCGRGAAAARGAELGAAEAAQAARLLGHEFRMIAAEAESAEEAARAARRMIEQERVVAIAGGFDAASAAAFGEAASGARIVFFNVGAPEDALRGAECRRSTFHVAASAAMQRDALELAALGSATPVLWDAELERFGAGQLNDRYFERFAEPMDGDAWASWLAVKILWESAARSRSTEPEALVRYLEHPRTRFDGHKGVPLSFREWDHQLRQPLYVRGRDHGSLMEVPQPSRDTDEDWFERLDRLGTTGPASACRFEPLPPN